MYYVDVKSTFGNERAEQSTGTAGPVFTAERTRARRWCKELRNAPGRTLDVLVAGAASGMAPYGGAKDGPARPAFGLVHVALCGAGARGTREPG